MENQRDFCTECRRETSYTLKKIKINQTIREKEYTFEITAAFCNECGGDLGIPDFTSEFQFSNGAFSVADSGFTVDMAALDRRLTPQPHDNMYSDMYEYSFRKVL